VFSQFNRLAVRLDELSRRSSRRSDSEDGPTGPALRLPSDAMVDETLDLETADEEASGPDQDASVDEPTKVTPLRRR